MLFDWIEDIVKNLAPDNQFSPPPLFQNIAYR